MDFRILGPLKVVDGAGAVDLAGRQIALYQTEHSRDNLFGLTFSRELEQVLPQHGEIAGIRGGELDQCFGCGYISTDARICPADDVFTSQQSEQQRGAIERRVLAIDHGSMLMA